MTRIGSLVRSGWWAALAGGLIVVAVVVLALLSPSRDRGASIGDGRDPSTYLFDLSNAVIPEDHIVAAGIPRDGIEALRQPGTLTRAEVDARNQTGRGKFLLDIDRVVGVALGGAARAYPLRTMRWHEVVNDTLDGVPVVVTYNGLCDAAMAAERVVAGNELDFGVSGLLHNSNLLMYDRRDSPADSSLWSQLRARAVAGPAAGHPLSMIPAALTTWGDWKTQHPRTDVLAPLEHLKRAYKRDPYHSYFGSDVLRFPVDPLPPDDDLGLKDRVVVVTVADTDAVYSLSRLANAAGSHRGWWEATVNDAPIRLRFDVERGTALVELLDDSRPVTATRQAFWFAWYSHYPDTPDPLP